MDMDSGSIDELRRILRQRIYAVREHRDALRTAEDRLMDTASELLGQLGAAREVHSETGAEYEIGDGKPRDAGTAVP